MMLYGTLGSHWSALYLSVALESNALICPVIRGRIVAQRTVAVIGKILPYAAGADLPQNEEEDEAE